jgi:hypothetical protein
VKEGSRQGRKNPVRQVKKETFLLLFFPSTREIYSGSSSRSSRVWSVELVEKRALLSLRQGRKKRGEKNNLLFQVLLPLTWGSLFFLYIFYF